ncbi:MAG: hypothetical protein WBC51_14690 [Vicinamibacterales bacterium]
MARIHRAKVMELATALQEPDSRSEATEALRGLVDATGRYLQLWRGAA